MATAKNQLPPLPEIGHPESYYARKVHEADMLGDVHSREAHKAAQYVTLGNNPRLDWSHKLRYYQHALRRHCNAPAMADDQVWMFYRQLAVMVRENAGREALRLASAKDDGYAQRKSRGESSFELFTEAETFFRDLTGDAEKCPEHFTADDWDQIMLLRNQWRRR